MNTPSEIYSVIAKKVMDCTAVVWAADPSEHPLGQLGWKNDSFMTPKEALGKLEIYLREIQLDATNLTPGVLTAWLRSTYSCRKHLSNWQPLLVTARQVITDQLGETEATSILVGLDRDLE